MGRRVLLGNTGQIAAYGIVPFGAPAKLKAMAWLLFDRTSPPGGEIAEGGVTKIVRTSAGKILLRGMDLVVEMARVILATGPRPHDYLRTVGESAPLPGNCGYRITFHGYDDVFRHSLYSPSSGFYVTPMDGFLRAAGTVEFADDRDPPGRSPTPDSLPVIAEPGQMPGFSHAFGHGHHGMCIGGITGHLITSLVEERALARPVGPFFLSRIHGRGGTDKATELPIAHGGNWSVLRFAWRLEAVVVRWKFHNNRRKRNVE